jgi:hypothetical protein
MLERVFDTIQGILYNDLPKNSASKVVVYDRPIEHWFIGERQIKPSNISITLSGASSPLNDVSYGFQEFEHTVNIEIDAGSDNVDSSERIIQEATRLMMQSIRRHRRMWVLEICPICEKFALSPEHYTIAHNSLLSSYVTAANTDFQATWSYTHPVSSVAPSLPDSGVATEALYRLYEDIKNSVTVAGLSDSARRRFLRMSADFVEPIRMLYNVRCTQNEFSDNSTGKQLFKSGKITIQAKELVRIEEYGPDNVPTTAY